MTDAISRQAAIEAIDTYIDKFDAIDANFLDGLKTANKLMMQLPPAQLARIVDGGKNDCVSRQSAIDGLRDYLVGKRCPDDGTLTCRLIENEVINKLQPIQPKDEVDSTARTLTGQAANLIENIINRGGSKEDLIDAIKYSLCCLDAKKYGLDLDDAQEKFRYHELREKYSA